MSKIYQLFFYNDIKVWAIMKNIFNILSSQTFTPKPVYSSEGFTSKKNRYFKIIIEIKKDDT